MTASRRACAEASAQASKKSSPWHTWGRATFSYQDRPPRPPLCEAQRQFRPAASEIGNSLASPTRNGWASGGGRHDELSAPEQRLDRRSTSTSAATPRRLRRTPAPAIPTRNGIDPPATLSRSRQSSCACAADSIGAGADRASGVTRLSRSVASKAPSSARSAELGPSASRSTFCPSTLVGWSSPLMASALVRSAPAHDRAPFRRPARSPSHPQVRRLPALPACCRLYDRRFGPADEGDSACRSKPSSAAARASSAPTHAVRADSPGDRRGPPNGCCLFAIRFASGDHCVLVEADTRRQAPRASPFVRRRRGRKVHPRPASSGCRGGRGTGRSFGVEQPMMHVERVPSPFRTPDPTASRRRSEADSRPVPVRFAPFPPLLITPTMRVPVRSHRLFHTPAPDAFSL